jgi:hypothetical protein
MGAAGAKKRADETHDLVAKVDFLKMERRWLLLLAHAILATSSTLSRGNIYVNSKFVSASDLRVK